MKILFFSVHAAIWVHAVPENRLVCELIKAGHDVSYVSCGRAFPDHCTSMSANLVEMSGPPEVKSMICQVCEGNAKVLADGSGARHYRLMDHVSKDDLEAITDQMACMERDRYLDFRVEGIDVGRLAAYELFLKYKKMSLDLTPEE